MSLDPDPAGIARDPLWLPHRYDPTRDAVQFVRISREVHRAATFLTDECLPEGAERAALRRKDAVSALPPGAPVHFIFHSAFCCSTLLARAFDIEGISMGLKEPVILNDISGWRRRGGQPHQVAEVLDHALTLLARPFTPGEAVIIKPSNVVSAYSPAMLAMRTEARALLLHAPLPVFLGSVARKGMWGRLWVRELMVKLIADDLIDLGFSGDDYLGLTDLQAAAVGWLAQHALFHRLVERFGAERVRTLGSETLLARPAEAVAALARLYNLRLDADAVAAVATGPAFMRHSKFGQEFDREARAAERRDLEAAHSDEIAKVAVWAEAVAANVGVSMDLKAPLLG